MPGYEHVPGIDDDFNFPAEVRQALADSTQFEEKYAYMDGGVLSVDGDPVPLDPSPVAGLDTVGWAKAVFIEEGGTVPIDADPWTIVIEMTA